MELRFSAVLETAFPKRGKLLRLCEVIVDIIHLDPTEQSCSILSSLIACMSHHREVLMITAAFVTGDGAGYEFLCVLGFLKNC